MIKLVSVTGDADIFVIFSDSNPNKDSFDYRSRRINHIDQVTLIEQGENSNLLNRKIFFSVYGNAKSQFKFEFEYEYKTLFNEKLLSATQLGDGQVLPQVLINE